MAVGVFFLSLQPQVKLQAQRTATSSSRKNAGLQISATARSKRECSRAIDFFQLPPRRYLRAECVNCERGEATLISRLRPAAENPHISVFIAFGELNIVARIQYCSVLYSREDRADGAAEPVAPRNPRYLENVPPYL